MNVRKSESFEAIRERRRMLADAYWKKHSVASRFSVEQHFCGRIIHVFYQITTKLTEPEPANIPF